MPDPFENYGHPLKLILADLDGTVTEDVLSPFDCDELRLLRGYNERAAEERAVPPLSLVTGRPQPFLEAVARLLATPLPSLFESGCGMYLPGRPLGKNYRYHPALSEPAVARAVARFRDWADEELVAKRGAGYILGKRYAVSLAAGASCPVEELLDVVEHMPAALAPHFYVTRSVGVVDVTPRAVNKGVGVAWLLAYCREELGLDIGSANVVGVGDSYNDLPFLSRVGISCAVANAAAEVRDAVAYVTAGTTAAGVADVIERAAAVNRRLGCGPI